MEGYRHGSEGQMDLGDGRQTTRQGEEDGNEKSRVVLSEYADMEREMVDGRRQFREDRSTAAIREDGIIPSRTKKK